MYRYSTKSILESIRRKKKLKIELSGDQSTNKHKIDLIRFEARKLKYTFDTSAVILISLSNDLVYKDFIRLIDICRMDSIRRYAPVGNCFIIYGEPPLSPKINDNFECFLCNDVVYLKQDPKKSFIKRFSDSIYPFRIVEIVCLAVLWLLLVTICLIRNRNKKKLFISPPSSTP